MVVNEVEYFVGNYQSRFGQKEEVKKREITTLGLAGEVGEVLELYKKELRDGKEIDDLLLLEFGDVLHYLTIKIHERGMTLTEVAHANMHKLRERHGKEMDYKYEYQSK